MVLLPESAGHPSTSRKPILKAAPSSGMKTNQSRKASDPTIGRLVRIYVGFDFLHAHISMAN